MTSLDGFQIVALLVVCPALGSWQLQAGAEASPRPAVTVSKVAAANNHALAVAADGTVWAWGINLAGQLGDGTTTNRVTPVQVSGLTDVVAVSGGLRHSLALKSDGTVWSWGANDLNQLGDGTSTARLSPVQVSGLTAVVALEASLQGGIALKRDGTLWAWGFNSSGQLGDGTTTRRNTPVQVLGLTGVVAMSAGGAHGLAVKSDGTVWVWGSNTAGQLGDGTSVNRSMPLQVSNLTGIIAVAGGAAHSLALKSDGTVWAWGLYGNAVLGGGSTTAGAVVRVTGLTDIASLAAGQTHSLAVRKDGSIWVWGMNDQGQLGDGTAVHRLTAVQLPGLAGAVAVAAGDNFSLALRNDGTLWAWGTNLYGQLGKGSIPYRITPRPTGGLTSISALGAGTYSLALKNDSSVWTWGGDAYLQSDVATTNPGTPIRVGGMFGALTSVTSIAAGSAHNLAAKSDGTVWAWGDNFYGQLGDGSTMTSRSSPAQVSGLAAVSNVSGGATHSLAQKLDGTVWAWGSNSNGKLGDGTSTQSSYPVQVSGLTTVVAVAAGGGHSLALHSGGTVHAWGSNSAGQLGDGSKVDRYTPVPVNGLSAVLAVAAGGSYSLALKTDGTVWAWGLNSDGQLGDGTKTDRSVPVQVSKLSSILAVAAGSTHGLALRTDGTLWAWGSNGQGQLGDGTTTSRSTPVQVGWLSGVTAIAAGFSHSLALRQDGTVWAWGGNGSGQLGDGTNGGELSPVPVVQPGSADLSIAMTHAGNLSVGTTANYTITVSNVGLTPSTGQITVTDTLPSGLINPNGAGDNWTCAANGQVLTCTHPGPIAPGAGSAITLNATVTASASPGATNVATVSNAADRSVHNDTIGDPLYLDGAVCTFTVTPPSASFPAAGGSVNFTIQTASGCPWAVQGLPPWITASGTATGTGPGAVTLASTANSSPARTANVFIAGVSIVITQAAGACGYALSASSQSFTASGGTGGVDLATTSACPWTAAPSAAWLIITSATSGTGSAHFDYAVAPNPLPTARVATLAIAGLTFTVQQAGSLPATVSFAGALPQVASGAGWKTTFTIANTGTSPITIKLNFWGGDGKQLTLPMSFPQSPTGSTQGASLDRTIAAGATLLIDSEAPASAPALVGWAELLSSAPVSGLAVFRQRSGDGLEQEAAVPLESRSSSAYLLQFDNSSGYATGLAAANHTALPVVLMVIQRDDSGRQIGAETLVLPAKGHTSFDLKSRWPALANRRGTIEVEGPSPGSVSILGLRFHPQGPFTTLPVAAR